MEIIRPTQNEADYEESTEFEIPNYTHHVINNVFGRSFEFKIDGQHDQARK